MPPQLLDGDQERGLVAGGRERNCPQVLAQIEVRGVNPDRPAKQTARHVEKLAESRHEVQPGCDNLPHDFEAEAAIRVEQAGAIEDGESADFLRPDAVRPQHDLVVRGQPIHVHHRLIPT
jgi:hypothetical protein